MSEAEIVHWSYVAAFVGFFVGGVVFGAWLRGLK